MNDTWPHPRNEEFNTLVKNLVNIHIICSDRNYEIRDRCRNYLLSLISNLQGYKILRDTEEHYRSLSLEITSGQGSNREEIREMVTKANMFISLGEWDGANSSSDWGQDARCIEEAITARTLGSPMFGMWYDDKIPVENLTSYLEPVRPIQDNVWDKDKQGSVLIYETAEGLLEVIDGNHRYEYANRLGTVKYLSGWIIREDV